VARQATRARLPPCSLLLVLATILVLHIPLGVATERLTTETGQLLMDSDLPRLMAHSFLAERYIELLVLYSRSDRS
jgi:hypothetical protein